MTELKTAVKQCPGYISIEIYLEDQLAGSRYSYKKLLELSLPDAIYFGNELISKASCFYPGPNPLFPKGEEEAETEILEEAEAPDGIFGKIKNCIKETK